eukprot:TRINITY_DN8093_c0_g2_i1.p1 TRINITY_DN8093_c0_g2~~TRINITY_DN8093_c0_g2_i1.p1  ORF type:complete len:814 (+),score=291.28 TRINITY_DN8093_c0_g2_i1:81-2522(+)
MGRTLVSSKTNTQTRTEGNTTTVTTTVTEAYSDGSTSTRTSTKTTTTHTVTVPCGGGGLRQRAGYAASPSALQSKLLAQFEGKAFSGMKPAMSQKLGKSFGGVLEMKADPTVGLKPSTAQNIQKLFSEYDVDGNGSLDKKELTALLTEMTGCEIKGDGVAKILDTMDSDGDGQVSPSEFAAAYPMLKQLIEATGCANPQVSTPQCHRQPPRVRVEDGKALPAPTWHAGAAAFNAATANGKPSKPTLVVFGQPRNGRSSEVAGLIQSAGVPYALLEWKDANKDAWKYGFGTISEPYVSVLRTNGTHVAAKSFFTDSAGVLAFFEKHKHTAGLPPKTPPMTPLAPGGPPQSGYLDPAAFKKHLNNGKPAKPTLVVAGRQNCGNCKFAHVQFKALQERGVPVLKVDVDKDGFWKAWQGYTKGGSLPFIACVLPNGTSEEWARGLPGSADELEKWFKNASASKAGGAAAAGGASQQWLAPRDFHRKLNQGRPDKAVLVVGGRESCGNCTSAMRPLKEAEAQGVPVLMVSCDGDGFWRYFTYSSGGMLPFVAVVRSDGTHQTWEAGPVRAGKDVVAFYTKHKGVDAETLMPASPLFLKDPKTPQEQPLQPARVDRGVCPEPGLSFMTAQERDVWLETNLARMQPREYARFVQAECDTIKRAPQQFGGKWGILTGNTWLLLEEGPAAWQEAIDFLKRQKPLPPYTAAPKGLVKACRDHCHDTGPKGITGHSGTDGSAPQARMNRHGKWMHTCSENIWYGDDCTGRHVVLSLIVDSGVPSRGHRKNIYSEDHKACGVGVGKHKTYKTMCCCNMAGAYVDK